MQTIILSNSVHETYAWADAKERHRRSVRHVPHAASLQGRAYDGIVELPSFAQRRDRHAVMAQLKKLRRSLPNIPYSLEEDWVMPERKPTPREVEVNTRRTLLLGDVGEPIHNMSLDELKADRLATENYFDDAEVSAGEMVQEASGTVDSVQEMLDEARDGEPFDKSEPLPTGEVEVTNDTGVAEPVEQPKPKRKGRRTNEQKAYDETLTAWKAGEAELNDLRDARAALAKRHPDDERLVPTEEIHREPDLDF